MRALLLVRNTRFREWSRASQPDGYPVLIDIRMNDDPNERADAVLRGGADLAIEVASANIARLVSGLRPNCDGTHSRTRPSSPSTSGVRHVDDVHARRAVNLAIDRAALARRLGGGGLSPATCQILPANFPGHHDYCPWTRGPKDGRWHAPDIPRARALARASGTAGSAVQVVVRRDDPTAPSAAAVVATALRRVGYRPRLSSLGTGPAFERRIADQRRWSMTGADWIADYPAPGQLPRLLPQLLQLPPRGPSWQQQRRRLLPRRLGPARNASAGATADQPHQGPAGLGQGRPARRRPRRVGSNRQHGIRRAALTASGTLHARRQQPTADRPAVGALGQPTSIHPHYGPRSVPQRPDF
jgi:ABC-type transport system substrate-binding protein